MGGIKKLNQLTESRHQYSDSNYGENSDVQILVLCYRLLRLYLIIQSAYAGDVLILLKLYPHAILGETVRMIFFTAGKRMIYASFRLMIAVRLNTEPFQIGVPTSIALV